MQILQLNQFTLVYIREKHYEVMFKKIIQKLKFGYHKNTDDVNTTSDFKKQNNVE